jgi:hypothetical protein
MTEAIEGRPASQYGGPQPRAVTAAATLRSLLMAAVALISLFGLRVNFFGSHRGIQSRQNKNRAKNMFFFSIFKMDTGF